MAIKKITNHQALAKARLPGFMQGATNIEALIDAIVAETQNLETVFCQLLDERHLTVAVGKQLDGIGQILDLERIISETDSEYRSKLISRSGELAKGGEIETLLAVFVNLTGLTVPDELLLTEIFPAAIIMSWLTDTSDPLDPVADAELISTMNAIRAGGVRLDMIRANVTDAFEFSQVSEVVGGDGPIDSDKGFGDVTLPNGGKLGRIITSIPVITDLIFHASFNTGINADFSEGDSVPIDTTGSPVVSGGLLLLSPDPNKWVSYDAALNADMGLEGCIRTRIRTTYSGSPTNSQMFTKLITDPPGQFNNISIEHIEVSGRLDIIMFNNSFGSIKVLIQGTWAPVSGSIHELELNYNWNTGVQETRFFIDGTQFQATASTDPGETRTNTNDRIDLGRGGAGTNNEFDVSDIKIFNAVQHTADYTV